MPGHATHFISQMPYPAFVRFSAVVVLFAFFCTSCLSQFLVHFFFCFMIWRIKFLQFNQRWIYISVSHLFIEGAMLHLFMIKSEVPLGSYCQIPICQGALQCCVSFCCAAKVNQLCLHMYPLFKISFSFRSSQSTEQGSLCQGRFSLLIYFICTVAYTCQFQYPNSSHPPFPTWCPYIWSLCVCFYFCFANRFICTIFLDCTYML